MRQLTSEQSGYTLVEALIFLAVSSLIFIMAVVSVGGQSRRTEFVQAARDFESDIQDLANDINTGFANYTFGSDTCRVSSAGAVTINATPLGGGDSRCVYLGKVIQFFPSGTNAETYDVHTLVGAQKDSATGNEATTLTEAKVSVLDNTQRRRLIGNGVTFGWLSSDGGATKHGAYAFTMTFQSYSADNTLASAASYVNVSPVQNVVAGTTTTANMKAAATAESNYTPMNPSGGLTICLNSGGTNQHALIKLGGDNAGRLRTSAEILSGSCP